jgi:hypothetical protein
VNHSWKPDGDPAQAVARTCELCGAAGRRFRSGQGSTRWETRLAAGQPWVAGRVPPCPAERKGSYVSVRVLLAVRLKAEGIIPAEADLELEHLPGDWQNLPTPEHPAWLGKWAEDGRRRMVFSCYPMRSCAEAPEIRMQGDQVIPVPGGQGAASTAARTLEIAPGQTWLSRKNGSLVRITGADDDLISYERVSGPGRTTGSLRARSLVQHYAEVRRP